jgi:GalNAc-alpha-(1->4)-GalNAc-alpha-(1->3)-diNAcBac-PP-undecaprenol alpha-1,4-N-acetyl-D-galactosaminyltransferase
MEASETGPETTPIDASATRLPIGRIALYFHRLGTGGGAQRMVCLLANALCARGFIVHLVTWDPPDATTPYELDPRVTWNRLDFYSGLAGKLRRTAALARLLRDQGVQVLVGFVMSGDKTVYAAAKIAGVYLIAAERNAPTMYHLRYGFAARWLSFGMLHLADGIAVQMPEFVRGYPATLRGRIEVIPNPVPVAKCRAQPEKPNSKGRFSLLAVGRLDGAQKGYECLLRAFNRVAGDRREWDLRIVGTGPNQDALQSLASHGGMAQRVRFEPWTLDIEDAYCTSHLFAIPSLWEGFPNALAEAMSHGLPAIGFRDAAGVAQLISDGETGWLADGLSDECALARVLSRAMADSDERARRGARAAESMTPYAPESSFGGWSRLLLALMEKNDASSTQMKMRRTEQR